MRAGGGLLDGVGRFAQPARDRGTELAVVFREEQTHALNLALRWQALCPSLESRGYAWAPVMGCGGSYGFGVMGAGFSGIEMAHRGNAGGATGKLCLIFRARARGKPLARKPCEQEQVG